MSRPVFIWQFALLSILPSKLAHLGGTVATIGFPDIGLQGFSPKLAKGEIASLSGAGDDRKFEDVVKSAQSAAVLVLVY